MTQPSHRALLPLVYLVVLLTAAFPSLKVLAQESALDSGTLQRIAKARMLITYLDIGSGWSEISQAGAARALVSVGPDALADLENYIRMLEPEIQRLNRYYKVLDDVDYSRRLQARNAYQLAIKAANEILEREERGDYKKAARAEKKNQQEGKAFNLDGLREFLTRLNRWPRSGPKISPELARQYKGYLEVVQINENSDRFFMQNAADRIEEWRTAAEKGDAVGQLFYARCLRLGTATQKNEQEALQWLSKSADQGLAAAQNSLGVTYRKGAGVRQDNAQAFIWYNKAAEQGFAAAQNSLGSCYRFGWGVSTNEQEALKWYHKAAGQGYASAENNIGRCYQTGFGVPKDEREAVRWFQKAADRGNAIAQENLAHCYLNGSGITKDKGLATKWFTEAIRTGDEETVTRSQSALRDIN